jgi:hypothetical protein
VISPFSILSCYPDTIISFSLLQSHLSHTIS